MNRLKFLLASPLFILTGILLAKDTLRLADHGLARPFRKYAPMIARLDDSFFYNLSFWTHLIGGISIALAGIAMLKVAISGKATT